MSERREVSQAWVDEATAAVAVLQAKLHNVPHADWPRDRDAARALAVARTKLDELRLWLREAVECEGLR